MHPLDTPDLIRDINALHAVTRGEVLTDSVATRGTHHRKGTTLEEAYDALRSTYGVTVYELYVRYIPKAKPITA